MRKLAVKIISWIPFYIIATDIISNFVDLSEDSFYWKYATLNGHSVATNMSMLLTVFAFRFCVQTKIATIAISLITFISLFAHSHYWAYVAWYDCIIYGTALFFVLLKFLRK